MSLLDRLFKKDEPAASPAAQVKIDPQQLAQNQQVLAGLEDLAKKVSMNTDNGDGGMGEYLNRLREEESGQ